MCRKQRSQKGQKKSEDFVQNKTGCLALVRQTAFLRGFLRFSQAEKRGKLTLFFMMQKCYNLITDRAKICLP